MKTAFAVTALLTLVACAGSSPPSPMPTPSPTATPATAPQDDLPTLIAALNAAGLNAREAAQFSPEPLGGRGVNVCVGAEPVNVYVYGTPDEAAARAATIDRRDPSHIGNSIVDWAGTPKFWLGGTIIVLYLGTDGAVQTALTSALGDPFTVGRPGRPPLRGPDC